MAANKRQPKNSDIDIKSRVAALEEDLKKITVAIKQKMKDPEFRKKFNFSK